MFEIEPDALIQDKYVLKRELGAGGFGLVWLAGHKNLTNRLVAIKFGMNLIGDAKDRFANEIKILDLLSDNPYIIKAEDVGNHGQIPYLVLEYAPEGDLDSYASKNPPTLTNIAGWLKQLANALDYAHSKGIVHRDLKPANILFMRDGSLRLCDFGIAHDDYNQFTVSGYSMGTLEYMSPEQIRSFRGVGPQTDTWALGVITLKLITGRALFDAKNASSSIIEVYEAVTNATVPTLTIDRTGAKVPLGMQKVIERVLEKDPAKRLKYYPTVTKFAEEFAAAIAPRPAKVFIANKPPLPSPQRFPAQAANPTYAQTILPQAVKPTYIQTVLPQIVNPAYAQTISVAPAPNRIPLPQ